MAPKKSVKKRNKATPRQMKLIEERAKGKSYSEAAIAAGYSEKNARQSGYQAMQQLPGRVPDLLDRHGLSEEVLIDKYLRPLLNANETKFFPTGIKIGGKKISYYVNVEALGIRHAALRTAFELHGSYAPRDPKEAAQYGVKIIRVDIPRPSNEFNQFIDVIPESALSRHGVRPVTPTNGKPPNGTPPGDKNGHD
jgi:hypothetical protein